MRRWTRSVPVGAAVVGALVAASPAAGQSAGQFVIPAVRADAGTRFAFWDLFQAGSDGFNYNIDNPTALLGGEDHAGNPTTLTSGVTLKQNGTPQAFVTGTGAIYSFSAATAFRVEYTLPAAGDVTSVIFQTQTGGVRFDVENIRLEFTTEVGGQPVTESLVADFKALDDPQSGGFAERLVSAFQWDLSGLDVRHFALVFSAPDSSMPMWEAQLDVIEAAPFVQQLGYLLVPRALPDVRFGVAGKVEKNLPAGAETRFHLSGTPLELSGTPTDGFAHAGWLFEGQIVESPSLPVVIGTSDLEVAAVFAPVDYATWRNHWFLHSNELLGRPADNVNDEVSAPGVDHDGDGATNFAEFAFGGDPYTGDAAPRAVKAGRHEDAPTLAFRRPASEFAAVTYQLEASTDLRTWQAVASQTVSRRLEADGYWEVTVREDAPAGTARPFLRCVATAEP